jgi:hypothetical protein
MMNNTDLMLGNAAALEHNKNKRTRKQAQVTVRDSYASADDAMNEMRERKMMRGASYRETKMADYRDRYGLSFDEATSMNFADAEYRRAIKEGKMRGDFAGEGMSFPIASPEDVRRAWMSVGRSDQPTEKLQRNILRIAKKYNWTNGLPDAVKKRMKKGGSGMPDN